MWSSKSDTYGRTYFHHDGSQPVCELSSSGAVTAQTMFGANGLISRNTNNGTTFYPFDERDSHCLLSGQTFST